MAKGTYYENINFKGKPITVKSKLGPDSSIIDGSNPSNPDSASVVYFISGEDSNSVLEGFTIRGGTGTFDTPSTGYRAGGGIYCRATPTIKRCVIVDNILSSSSMKYGGGVFEYHASGATLINCTISHNKCTGGAFTHGAGNIYLS